MTTHTDILPTLLKLAGLPLPEYLDGAPIPLHEGERKLEAFGVEYWSALLDEERGELIRDNNYKSVRYLSKSGRNYLYTVRCADQERELYDMSVDPWQLVNKIRDPSYAKLVDRLDALLEVLRACQGKECREPWKRYHPDGSVSSLDDAMNPSHDGFYAGRKKLRFRECSAVHDLYREGISDTPGEQVRAPGQGKRKPARMLQGEELGKAGWREAEVERQGMDMKMPKVAARM